MPMQKPLTIVIFGATGDLFQKKLAAALFDLYSKKVLPARADIIGFSRKAFSHDAFRALFAEWIMEKRGHDEKKAEEFVSRAFYHQGDLGDEKSYESLGRFLEGRDRASGVCSDKLFYLAVPPNLYETVFTRLAKSGLTLPCAPGLPDEAVAWTRVLVEKPFGNNEKEAARLDRLLGSLFEEEQIFRIDHYLAKETVQNIIMFRFSNGLFEPLWNRSHIERVEIRMLEKEGVGTRGFFYDGVGALRDVGQNHVLQMLALIGMEHPGKFEAEHIRRARRAVLAKVAPAGRRFSDYAVRAQYEEYRREPGVSSDSDTETFFRLTMRIQNARWKGVPFVLASGKALSRSEVSISVFFKPTPCLCPAAHEEPHQNVLTFHISPREEISLLFWAKRPGFDFGLEQKILSFSFGQGALEHSIPDAYERVLLDSLRGDQTLFASTEEVKLEWRITTPLLEGFNTLPLRTYRKGEEEANVN